MNQIIQTSDMTDLTIPYMGTIVNIRVLLLINTPDGYIFERNKNGFYFAIGGRVKIGESTQEAAYRELNEEIGECDIELNMNGVIENFFNHGNVPYHEINFVYTGELNHSIELWSHEREEDLIFISSDKLKDHDIKPQTVVEFIEKFSGSFVNLVSRDR